MNHRLLMKEAALYDLTLQQKMRRMEAMDLLAQSEQPAPALGGAGFASPPQPPAELESLDRELAMNLAVGSAIVKEKQRRMMLLNYLHGGDDLLARQRLQQAMLQRQQNQAIRNTLDRSALYKRAMGAPGATLPPTSLPPNNLLRLREEGLRLDGASSTSQDKILDFPLPRRDKEPFPRKLHRMLCDLSEDPKLSKIASWTEGGRSFQIFRPDRFVREVMQYYFRTQRFTSFRRQLNLYGFVRQDSGMNQGCYSHPLLVRDSPELSNHIVLKRRFSATKAGEAVAESKDNSSEQKNSPSSDGKESSPPQLLNPEDVKEVVAA